jgi:SAM-dependent methyltransferase
MKCRFCFSTLHDTIFNFGNHPLSNGLLTDKDLLKPEQLLPLQIMLCHDCLLVQTRDVVKPESIFNSEYPYLSSTSHTWQKHAEDFCEFVMSKFQLSTKSKIIEVASNDGSFLKCFANKGLEVLGIEPVDSIAVIANNAGIKTIPQFMSQKFATDYFNNNKKADLLIANNVLAHVPNICDFVDALKTTLAPHGILSIEFPSLQNIKKLNQFDTFYHEHFSYLTFTTACKILESRELKVFHVSKIPTHGGSLRIFAEHKGSNYRTTSQTVALLLDEEAKDGIHTLDYYRGLDRAANLIRENFLQFVNQQIQLKKKILAYGAAAKGNTFLNFCQINKNQISYVADAAPTKQGKYLPGTHIKIIPPQELRTLEPDYIVILPWNIREEICLQLADLHDSGCRFVVALPQLEIW